MTFSTDSTGDVKEVGVGLLRGRGGVWKNSMSFPEQVDMDPRVVGALARDLAMLCEEQQGEQQTSIRSALDGFSVSFDTRSSFAKGSAELTPALEDNLRTVGNALQRYTHLIVVEGFTDAEFTPTRDYPSAVAMGLARAQNAARYLLDHSKIPPNQLQIASVGSLRPRVSNDTAGGRTSNRRIEIKVLALARNDAAYRDGSPVERR
jgi:flagellar motor protein MotB